MWEDLPLFVYEAVVKEISWLEKMEKEIIIQTQWKRDNCGETKAKIAKVKREREMKRKPFLFSVLV